MREVVARRSPLPFPTHQERAEVFLLIFLKIAMNDHKAGALLLFQNSSQPKLFALSSHL